MKKSFAAALLAALLAAALLASCAAPAATAPTPEPTAAAPASASTEEPTPAPTPEPTAKPAPSPEPTLTPTATPEPTPAPTPGDFVPVTEAMGEDWPWLPEGAEVLTEEELASWQARFDEDWMLTQFLSSAYTGPGDVDLFQLLYNGISLPERDLRPLLDIWLQAPEEGAWLLGRLGAWPFEYDTVKLPRSDVDALLRTYLGLGLEDMSGVGLDRLYYIPEADAWYTAHGDTNRQQVKFLYGYTLGDEVCLFHRGIAFYQSEDRWTGEPAYDLQQGVFRTVLRLGEEGFRFVSNLLALTDGTEGRNADPGSVNLRTLDLSGDYGREVYRLEPETVTFDSADAARASLEEMDGFALLLEHDYRDYGTLVYGEAGEEPYLFFLTGEGVRYRLHLPVNRLGAVPLDPEQDYGRAEEGTACVLDGWNSETADWLTGCVMYTDLGNGEERRMGEARWTFYLPAKEEFVWFRPWLPRTPLQETELSYRGVSIGDTVERMRSLLGEPEETEEHTEPSAEGLQYREYRYGGACFREAYIEDGGWTGTIGRIEIWDTSVYPGPRGILLGEDPESVMDLFPREYDYREDVYGRFYGEITHMGAGGCAGFGPSGEISVLVFTTDALEPSMMVYFEDGKAVRIFLGYNWI